MEFGEIIIMEIKKENKSPCTNCNSMTVSIREGRAKFECKECGWDKSLSDLYFYECVEETGSVGE
ncbi:hypothetical protein DRO91_10720 [Candidatus Heimdallarchaeota archaeon]|nr:MAG: hypothetical protein DRO91_10720 [Candidatus Heimdallarchaeota archaeon]